jgi:hypothetical protein
LRLRARVEAHPRIRIHGNQAGRAATRMLEVDIEGGTVARYLALPERGKLDYDDTRPPQVRANRVRAKILSW